MKKKFNPYMMALFIYLLAAILFFVTNAKADEPIISNFQGSDPKTSVIELIWPDGKVERLLYKNKDVDDGNKGYVKWFHERCDAYEARTGRKVTLDEPL